MKKKKTLVLFAVVSCLALLVSVITSEVKQKAEEKLASEPEDTAYVITMEYGRLYKHMEAENVNIPLYLDSGCEHWDRDGENIVAALSDGSIRRIDIKTGKDTVLEKMPASAMINGLAVYAPDCFIYNAYDNNSAKVYSWHDGESHVIAEDSWYLMGSPHVAAGALLYYNTDPDDYTVAYLEAMNAEDGTIRWRTKVDAERSFSPVFTQGNKAYVQCEGDWFSVNMEDGALIPALEYLSRIDSRQYDLLYVGNDGALLRNYGSLYNEGTAGVYYMPQTGKIMRLDDIICEANYCDARVCDAIEDKVVIVSQVGATIDSFNGSEYPLYYSTRDHYIVDMAKNTVEKMSRENALNTLFEPGEFPVIDSSTARKPFTAALYTLFCLSQNKDGAMPICNTTHGAWLAMADRTNDIAFLAYPTSEEQEYLDKAGVEVNMKPYGGDGLVFIGNQACGVDNLTIDTIRRIYRGEITNWSELGGPKEPIRVLYRDDQSGSQRLFEQLIWDGEPIPDYEALGFTCMDEMSGIVNECLYDPYSIGYSIMTYLNDVYGQEDLLAFSIRGIKPTPNNLSYGNYPLGTRGYVVIRADEPKDSPARRLYDWIGNPICDEVLCSCGITPLH